MYVACQLQMECFPSSEQRLSLLINLRNFALRTIVEMKLVLKDQHCLWLS